MQIAEKTIRKFFRVTKVVLFNNETGEILATASKNREGTWWSDGLAYIDESSAVNAAFNYIRERFTSVEGDVFWAY